MPGTSCPEEAVEHDKSSKKESRAKPYKATGDKQALDPLGVRGLAAATVPPGGR